MKREKKNLKLIITVIVVFVVFLLLIKGGPTNIDDEFRKYLSKKDIGAVLIGTLISNMFADNISTISENLILPLISRYLKVDLSKEIKLDGIKFNTNKIIISFIKLLVTVFVIIIVFNKL